jgi:hypothetical protein
MNNGLSPVNDTDFGRSFVRFSTTRVNHTPRLGLAASCTFLQSAKPPVTYHLSVACIAENMYLPRGHIQEPVATFNLVQLPKTEFMILRRHADAARDIRLALLAGQTMPTHDGKGAHVVELDTHVARFRRATPITTYADFRQALLDNHPLNGRTIYTEPDTQTTVILDYPITTCNVRHDREDWQIDAGPILMPAKPAEAGDTGLLVSRLDMAFIVYNRWDYAEAAICAESPVSESGKTNFYRNLSGFNCKNELFLLSDQ